MSRYILNKYTRNFICVHRIPDIPPEVQYTSLVYPIENNSARLYYPFDEVPQFHGGNEALKGRKPRLCSRRVEASNYCVVRFHIPEGLAPLEEVISLRAIACRVRGT